MNRLHGLDVCDACRLSPVGRVGVWVELEVGDERHYHPPPVASEVMGDVHPGVGIGTAATRAIEVRATGDVGLPTMRFSRESMGWLKRVFVREVEVGDPLFDDTVWVSTKDKAAAARLLAIDGVQSAILEAVSKDVDLRTEGKSVLLKWYGEDEFPVGEVAVLALSILIHARRLAG